MSRKLHEIFGVRENVPFSYNFKGSGKRTFKIKDNKLLEWFSGAMTKSWNEYPFISREVVEELLMNPEKIYQTPAEHLVELTPVQVKILEGRLAEGMKWVMRLESGEVVFAEDPVSLDGGTLTFQAAYPAKDSERFNFIPEKDSGMNIRELLRGAKNVK